MDPHGYGHVWGWGSRDRGKVKAILWACAPEASGFLVPQWASVTWRHI